MSASKDFNTNNWRYLLVTVPINRTWYTLHIFTRRHALENGHFPNNKWVVFTVFSENVYGINVRQACFWQIDFRS